MYEIGSYAGESAEVFSRYFRTVHCVDPWDSDFIAMLAPLFPDPPPDVEAAFAERALRAGNIVKHKARSLEVAPTVADGSLDFVYLDADKSYEAVAADIRAWWPKLKPGTYFGGHDWIFRDVRKAATEFFARDPDGTFNDYSWVYRKESEK
jgi:hypothetical protein